MIKLLFYILSIIFLLNAVVITCKGIVTVGLFMLYMLSLLSFIYARYYILINEISSAGFLYYLKLLIALGIIVYIFLICFILSYSKTTTSYNEDIVIVLGAGTQNGKPSPTLKKRLDAAIEYNYKNPSAYIVVTGGSTRKGDTTEAAVMKNYLLSHNIPENIILVEDQSTSTKENYILTKKALEENNISYNSMVYITNSFHSYRARVYAGYCGFNNITGISTKTDIYIILPALLREVLGVIDMHLLKLK